MDAAEFDVLGHQDFPAAHRVKIHSTNTLERLNKEIKRRANVVGIFPNEASIRRLIGHEPFQSVVLLFQLLQTSGLGDLHATELGSPFVEGGIRDAMLAAQVDHRDAGFSLFQDGNDLLFGETGLAHVGSFVIGIPVRGKVRKVIAGLLHALQFLP